MKLLKIYLAVLFFSFVGSMHNQVLAQGPEGSWTRSFKETDELTNGDYSAKIEKGTSGFELIVRKVSNKSLVSSYFVISHEGGRLFKSLDLKYDNYTKGMAVAYNTIPSFSSTTSLVKDGRNSFTRWSGKALDSNTEVTDSAYFQLEDDGKFHIYSGEGGVPIVILN